MLSPDITDHARTIALGEKAFAHIRQHRTAAYPRAYELWYTYAAGHHQALMRAVEDVLQRNGRLTQTELDDIYERFVNTNRFSREVEAAILRFLHNVDEIHRANENTGTGLSQFDEALRLSHEELGRPIDAAKLHDIVLALRDAVRDMSARNAQLSEQLVGAAAEVSEIREQLEAMRTEAHIDPATTLASRQFFDTSLLDAVKHAQRRGTPLTLLMCEVDRFLQLNETYGSFMGDQLLKLVATAIKQNIKGLDVAARFAPQQFAVLLVDSAHHAGLAIANRLHEALLGRQLVRRATGESLGAVSIFIGVASLRGDDTPSKLLDRARRCLATAIHGDSAIVSELDPVPAIRPATVDNT